MQIHEQLLPYHDKLERRDLSALRLVVIHCTEVPTLSLAREFGERIQYPESGTGASGHYYIDRDGRTFRYVAEDRVARHVVGHNLNSIGIELVNAGRYPHWFHAVHQSMAEPYTPEQIAALKELLRELRGRHPRLSGIARHSELDTRMVSADDDPSVQVRRRIDPGPLFPWDEIVSCWEELGGSHDPAESRISE